MNSSDPVLEEKKEFLSHFFEFRRRFIYSITAFLLVFFSLIYWCKDIFFLFIKPLLKILPYGHHMIVTDIVGSFFVPVKITIFVSFLISLPITLYHIWKFIAPGLYSKEKLFILPIIGSSYILFLIGIIFTYFVVFPIIFKFIVTYNSSLHVQIATDIEKYLDFSIALFLIFGFAFELPIFIIVLVKLNIVNISSLREMRSYAIIASFIISAIITPPDIFSQFLLAIPLCLLYEIGILVSEYYVYKKKNKK